MSVTEVSSALDRRLCSTIVTRVHAGRYPPGTRLPGERQLAGELGVSRTTLRRALQELARQGLLEASSKRGWFVPPAAVGEPPSTLQSFTEMTRARGQRPGARVLSITSRSPGPTEAGRLAIDDDAAVIELVRLRSIDDQPVCHDRSVLVADRVPGLLQADLTGRSLLSWLEQQAGIELLRSSYVVSAALVPAELTELLRLPAGSPVLVAEEVIYDDDQQPVLLGRLVYRADAYQVRSDLFRPSTGRVAGSDRTGAPDGFDPSTPKPTTV